MTLFNYVQGIPASGNNPSADQPNMLINNDNIFDLIKVDHIGFNQNDGGYHTIIHQKSETVTPGKIVNVGQSYVKDFLGDQAPFFLSGAGVETNLIEKIPVIASGTIALTAVPQTIFTTVANSIGFLLIETFNLVPGVDKCQILSFFSIASTVFTQDFSTSLTAVDLSSSGLNIQVATTTVPYNANYKYIYWKV